MPKSPEIRRWIGLDIHKSYFVAVGVDAEKQPVFGPQRVMNEQLEGWGRSHLQSTDAIVMEMTTNTYLFHDTLLPLVGSVMAVHPPSVRLVTGVKVKTDKKAALALAKLHAAGLLTGVWIPPVEVRELRAVIAQRGKMVRMATQAKNRLGSLLIRIHQERPTQAFKPQTSWWESLPLSPIEKSISFAPTWTPWNSPKSRSRLIEEGLRQEAAREERVPLLVQLPGIAILNALAILAAIGPIERFEEAKHLVGYAGLGANVHDSGQTHATGHITKAGRRDLRYAMTEGSQSCRPPSSPLEKRIRPVGIPPGSLQSHRGDCPASAHCRLAYPEKRNAGSPCGGESVWRLPCSRWPIDQETQPSQRHEWPGLCPNPVGLPGFGQELQAVAVGKKSLALPPSN